MESNLESNINWDELRVRIDKAKFVIPVIGEGLYWVNTPDAENVLLYPYLAEKLVKEMGLSPLGPNETFYQVMFRYFEQKPKDYMAVNDFISNQLESISLVPKGPLWQLARIKKFSLFINTTYDNYLEKTLKSVRSQKVEHTYYMANEKSSRSPELPNFKEVEERQRSHIFHIYGRMADVIIPAYTEKDILETLVTFHNDMQTDRQNKLFQALESSNLLFMGCRYDDWLFRFFIRTMTNTEYDSMNKPPRLQFVNDDFKTFNCGGLEGFLKSHELEVYNSIGNLEFVDHLFREIQEKHPAYIIQEDDFPKLAFISFHGKDRVAAERLATKLKEDGINVWYDEWDIKPGDIVDEKIAKAIAAQAVFIPIISHAAQQLPHEDGKNLRYHVKEWEWAYGHSRNGENPVCIIPVIIDNTNWMYESFQKYAYLKIPGGDRTGDYKKLCAHLQELMVHPKG